MLGRIKVLDTRFTDDDGNLYKPEEGGADFAAGTFSSGDFAKKTNEDEEDWSDVVAMFDALHDDTSTSDPLAWRQNLEAVFDVDGFLEYLAVNQVIQNWDTYGVMPHNYYLYNDPESGLLTWIPWDNNEALQDARSLALDFSDMDPDAWPLIARLYADAEYRAAYEGYLADVISGAFETNRMQTLYDAYAALVEPYATSELAGYSFTEGQGGFDAAVDALKTHAASRTAAVNAYLYGR